jgi:legumain
MRASLYLLLAALTLAYTEKHAVLVAGSNGFTNYRHQADLAHAYSILIDGGVPANNIIVMMYDDIAHSLRNKFKGKLFNRPDAADGTSPPDVYGPVKDHIDYRKHNVTPKNFLKVLTGDTSAPRVLTSGPDDDVFVYFADHGGVGILAFPDAIKFPPVPGKALHADELNDALKTMKSKNMFKRLVFYVEACATYPARPPRILGRSSHHR